MPTTNIDLKFSKLAFSCLSVVCLIFPRYIGPYNLGYFSLPPHINGSGSIILFLTCIILTLVYLACFRSSFRTVIPFILIAFFYILWITLSYTLHIYALKNLDPEAIITITGKFAEWGEWTTNRVAMMHLSFPILMVTALILFSLKTNPTVFLLALPPLYLPCIAVAFWQRFVDINFLNIIPELVAGNGAHPCSFGMAIYFMLPLSVMGIILCKKLYARAGYFIMAVLIVACHFLQTQITVSIGWILLAIIFIPVYLWVNNIFAGFFSLRNKKSFFLVCCLLICFLTPFILKYYIGIRSCINNKSTSILRYEPDSIDTFIDNIVKQKKDSARLALTTPALLLVKEAPISGWGPSGFRRNASNILYKFQPRKYYRTNRSILHHNAGDHYLQILTDFGLLGLLLAMLMHAIPLLMIFKVRKSIIEKEQRWAVGILGTSSCIWLILYLTGSHVFFLEVLWPFACVQAFLMVTAIRYGFSFRKNRFPWLLGLLALLTILFSLNAYKTSLGNKGPLANYKKLNLGQGYFPIEITWGEKSLFKHMWVGKNAKIPLKALSDIIFLKIIASPLNISRPEGLSLKILINNKLIDSVNFSNSSIKTLAYYIPDIAETNIVLGFQVSKTFNPYLLGKSSDNRNLGIQIWTEIKLTANKYFYNDYPIIDNNSILENRTAYISFEKHGFPVNLFLNRLPEQGIGLYGKETWAPENLPENFQDKPAEIRWTGMRASMYLPEHFKENGGEIFLKVAHPDVQQKNVRIKIMADSQIIIEKTFSDYSWQKITLTKNDLAGAEILTLIVDRTWNPKLTGQSEDTRDLGVAVLLTE